MTYESIRTPAWRGRAPFRRQARILLIGPYDPTCGEYTFLAPPLGVWRLAGYLRSLGHHAEVFDPNICESSVQDELRSRLGERAWDVVGISTTGMTLKYDLSLAHECSRFSPGSILVAGGMEATFNPDRLFELAPFDLLVLGEGEKPLEELVERVALGEPISGIPGTALPLNTGGSVALRRPAMSELEHNSAIAMTPYAEMPYRTYWDRLETAYALGSLPSKAEREGRLAEIRSVRLNTLNYCPMACSFCSSTNFLHEAQGSTAKVARLSADECMAMIEKVVHAQPEVRTVIFQDDIFVFTKDKRIGPLCDAIVDAKKTGRIPEELQFISTNRIDAMNEERLRAMKRAGFRVLGFGVENFSRTVLKDFNKAQIHRHIEPMLKQALGLGIRPFLDLIMSSPWSTLEDIEANIIAAERWMDAGCEVGLYPYVIPFSGAVLAADESLEPFTEVARQSVPGTEISFEQREHIYPIDERARTVMADICARYEISVCEAQGRSAHLPSRVRSRLWVAAASSIIGDRRQRKVRDGSSTVARPAPESRGEIPAVARA